MQYANPTIDWATWLGQADDLDEATKLSALREYITATARHYVERGQITREWANKKLARLGITERFDTNNTYEIETTVSGQAKLTVYARDRAAALASFKSQIANAVVVAVTGADAPYDPKFVSGPEDATQDADPDAPTTVSATLDKLREIIMLGNIAGPRFDCETGVNQVLAAYGLAPIPARKQFTVGVPVEGVMKTTVTAYDEESARRVAGWRWGNGHAGFDLDHVTDTDVMSVAAPN